MATVVRVTMIRPIRPFMSVLPALRGHFRSHGLSSSRPPCSGEHENRPVCVGRSVALLAPPHPKCPFQV